MAEQELIKIARDNIDAFNAGDWERFAANSTVDCVYDEVATQRRYQGPDQIVENGQEWKKAFPDATGTITSAIASGNTVTLEITWEGTHTGPLAGPAGTIPASGKRQTTRAAMVMTFEGDKIKENHQYFDVITLLQQIGAMPQPQQV